MLEYNAKCKRNLIEIIKEMYQCKSVKIEKVEIKTMPNP